MPSNYEIWLSRDDGTRLDLLNKHVKSISYTRIAQGMNFLRLVVNNSFDFSLFKDDNKIEVWRGTEDVRLGIEDIFFIRRRTKMRLTNGNKQIEVGGLGSNYILTSRIVDYPAGSGEGEKSIEADDMMKEIVDENMGAAAPADRTLTAAGFTVQGDATLGPVVTIAFARRQVWDVLRDIHDASITAETPVYFENVPTSPTTYNFQTFIDRLGADRRVGFNSNPTIFSVERGNIRGGKLSEDASKEITFVAAAGQGRGVDRNVQFAQNDDRINLSLWSRREAFKDARHESETEGVESAADQFLRENRVKFKFDTQFLDTPSTRYRVDWDLGDAVTLRFFDQEYDAEIKQISVSVDGNGNENIIGKAEINVPG